MTENNGACTVCGRSYHRWEFHFDEIGRTLLDHRCDPADIARFHQALPRYEQTARFGLMQCERCPKVIQRRRLNQRTCLECGAIVRKEQDAERWRKRSVA